MASAGSSPLENPAPPSLRVALPLLVAGFCIQFALIGGGVNTVSVFLNALTAAEGWSRQSLSLGVAIGALGAGLATPLVGILIDRVGVRIPMTIGVGLLGCGFGVLASMSEPWHFVAANALLGPGFAASAMLPITVAVAVRVPQKTALALGVVSVGSSVGALLLAPLAQAAIDAVGWRGAYGFMAMLIVLTPIPCLLFALPRGPLRRDGAGSGVRPRLDLAGELRRPGVLRLCGVMVLPGLVSFGVNVHMVPLLTDRGHSAAFAASVLGATIGVSALGKLSGGALGDRLGAIATLRAALLFKAIAIGVLALASSTAAVAVFVVTDGLAVGAQIAVMPVIALSILGRERFATLFGLLSLAAAMAIAVAPVVPGAIRDSTGSYDGALLFWGTALLAAVAVAFTLREQQARAGSLRSFLTRAACTSRGSSRSGLRGPAGAPAPAAGGHASARRPRPGSGGRGCRRS